jgi:hypothetical protein
VQHRPGKHLPETIQIASSRRSVKINQENFRILLNSCRWKMFVRTRGVEPRFA